MQALRRTGITVCAALAAAALVYAVIDLAESEASGLLGNSAAGLFGLSAGVLWRRSGRKRTGMAFGLLILGIVTLYVVLVEFRAHGYMR